MKPENKMRSDEELYQMLCRDEWDFTKEEWERIQEWDDVADPDEGEGIEMIIDD